MKKSIKVIFIVITFVIGIILFDSLQALIFDNNPIIGIDTRCMKRIGILVETYHCDNGKRDTVIKGFSYSCLYNCENYTLIDKTKKIKNFVCAEALEIFFENKKYVYYWSCIKNKYMVVEYDNGLEEEISEALRKGNIDINILDKLGISYIKEAK